MTNRRQLIDAVEVTDTGIHVVRMKRIFDATSVNEFEKVLAYLLAKREYRIVVDLTHVEFVASAGWGAFTAEFRNVRKAGGDIRLAAMSPDVQDVFFLLELDSFINAYETVDEAIASFEAEMPAVQIEEPAMARDAVETMSEYAHAPLETTGAEKNVTAFAGTEIEPAGFEVAEVYEPEFRAPLALGAGHAKPRSPEYASSEVEEGWVISEEAETDPAEDGAFALDATFAELAPEISFDQIADAASEAAGLDSESFEEETQATVGQTAPRARAAEAAHGNGEEWPEAQAEENVAVEDFELQDIHDPWILEEIDTLPEESELEDAEWSEGFQEEPVVAPVKPLSSPARAQAHEAAAPAAATPRQEAAASLKTAANAAASLAQNHEHEAPASRTSPRASSRASNEPATLADKVKAASKPEAAKSASSLVKTLSESECLQRVREIVSANPHYGPAMIQNVFETQIEPPMPVSRSTIYRWLRLTDLNTREQRLAFAGRASAP
jgi:anti-sigma B factor antagonist